MPASSSSQPTRKRSTTQPKRPSANKKARNTTTEAVHAGVGPSARTRTQTSQIETRSATPVVQSLPPTYAIDDPESKTRVATNQSKRPDCWVQVIGVMQEHRPSNQTAVNDAQTRAQAQLCWQADHLEMAKRPAESAYPRLLCIPCLVKNNNWKTWKNSGGGITTSVLKHLSDLHQLEYQDGRLRLGLPDSKPKQASDDISPEAITTEGMARYIAELVAEQDLSFKFSESRAFRRLLCYVGQKNIKSEDLPKRKAVTAMAMKLSQEAKAKIKEEMKHCLGRISMTSDLWSDEMERSFMAITGHFIDRNRNSVIVLLAFRFIEGSHTGESLGEYFFNVLKEYDILDKIGSITLDNAGNNNTMMDELQDRMLAEGYSFDKEGNRVRQVGCSIVLLVNSFLDGLSQCSSVYLAEREAKNEITSANSREYLDALDRRPDQLCQDTVVALRNGQRRRGLQQTIREGNERQHWKAKRQRKDARGELTGETEEVVLQLKLLQLLLAVKTRWSSKRNMIARFIYLYPAINEYLNKNFESLGRYTMTHMQFRVLQDIKVILDIFHRVQELLSAELTPCLSLAFPAYTKLVSHLQYAAVRFPALAFAINQAIIKINDYVAKSRTSPIHILAMFLNPCVKYKWIDENWNTSERQHARQVVKRYMHQYLEAKESDDNARMARYNLETSASRAQHRGVKNLFDWEDSLEYSYGLNPGFGTVTPTASPVVLRTSASYPSLSSPGNDSESILSQAASQRALTVDMEHEKYVGTTVWGVESFGQVDLVKHWTLQEISFPLLYPMSMDVLPAQASSVSSERVFSSSKLTCTRARNKIGTSTVEALQILKYSLRHQYILPTPEVDDADLDTVDSTLTLDLMRRLGDHDWDDDAILDEDPVG